LTLLDDKSCSSRLILTLRFVKALNATAAAVAISDLHRLKTAHTGRDRLVQQQLKEQPVRALK
jgi:hypothetical protein